MDKQIETLAKKIANDLVDEYRIILMEEDTECGNECLCSIIAIKMAAININDRIKELEPIHEIYGNINYTNKRINVLKQVLIELKYL